LDIPINPTPGRLFDIMWHQEDTLTVIASTAQGESTSGIRPPSLSEMHKYMGQQLFMGLYKLPAHQDYWREERPILARSIFHQGLGRERWCVLNAHIHIQPHELSDSIRQHFRAHRHPSSPIGIDETRIRFEGAYAGIIYTPTKPSKFAIECFSAADRTCYLWDFIPRLKEAKIKRKSAPVLFQEKLPARLSTSSTWHLVGDSKFGYLSTLEDLDQKGILCTFGSGKASPAYVWKYGLHQGLKKGEEKGATNGTLLAVSKFSRKRVNLWTNAFSWGNSAQYKAGEVLNYYDQHKHYVDDFNKMMALYYYDHRHYKWTQAFFDGLLKMAVTNAFMIHKSIAEEPMDYRTFLELLIEDLIQR
jgi:hypothetical protein